MIHKLAQGPITLTVTDIQSVEGQFGTQTQIDGEDSTGQDVRVYVSEMTAMRQLARLNLTPETVLGVTLTLSQVKKDGKTFTDFVIGDKAKPTPTIAASAPPVSAPAKLTVAELGALYAQCLDQAIGALAVLEGVPIPVDAQAVTSAAATLFIRAAR
jgi:hypothetical protein